MAESTWRPLNQSGRWGTVLVTVTAGNLSTGRLRVKRAEGGAEEEIDAIHFQAHQEYTPEWMNFLTANFQRQAGSR